MVQDIIETVVSTIGGGIVFVIEFAVAWVAANPLAAVVAIAAGVAAYALAEVVEERTEPVWERFDAAKERTAGAMGRSLRSGRFAVPWRLVRRTGHRGVTAIVASARTATGVVPWWAVLVVGGAALGVALGAVVS